MDSLPTSRRQHAPTVDLSGQYPLSSRSQVNLEHASGCSDPQCPLPVCVNLKMATSHARTCAQRKCDTCFQVKLITLHHVKSCRRDSSCPMPLCLETKVKQQYMTLMRELGGEVLVLTDSDSSLPPNVDSSPHAKPGPEAGSRLGAKRPESCEVKLHEVAATPQKLPRYEDARSLELMKPVPRKVQRWSAGSSGRGNSVPPKNHKPTQSVTAGHSPQKPGTSVLQVLQQLMQVLALSQTCEEEAVMVSLLERTVREAQAKITSFKEDQGGKPKRGRLPSFTDTRVGAVQELPQQLISSFDNRCPSPDFIRELFE